MCLQLGGGAALGPKGEKGEPAVIEPVSEKQILGIHHLGSNIEISL